jgi:hypothetical protein
MNALSSPTARNKRSSAGHRCVTPADGQVAHPHQSTAADRTLALAPALAPRPRAPPPRQRRRALPSFRRLSTLHLTTAAACPHQPASAPRRHSLWATGREDNRKYKRRSESRGGGGGSGSGGGGGIATPEKQPLRRKRSAARLRGKRSCSSVWVAGGTGLGGEGSTQRRRSRQSRLPADLGPLTLQLQAAAAAAAAAAAYVNFIREYLGVIEGTSQDLRAAFPNCSTPRIVHDPRWEFPCALSAAFCSQHSMKGRDNRLHS